MPPIRILQVVTQMNRGGLESRLMDIYREINREKVQFDFYTHRQEKGLFDDEIRSLGGIVYYNNNIGLSSIIFGDYKKTFEYFLENHPEYKTVHCHLNALSFLPLGVAKKVEVPTRIAHSRSAGSSGNIIKRKFKAYSKSKVWDTCTHACAVSKKAGEWLYGNKRFTVVPNAINAAHYRVNDETRLQIRQQFELSDSLVVGHVGSFNNFKNHNYLIDIFAVLKKTTPRSKLLLVGDGPLKAESKQRVDYLSLSKDVIFVGLQTDVAPFLMAMDVFVMPSLYEGLPGAAIEAQSAGLPCVISDSVTAEAGVVEDICKFLPLSQTPDKWASEAIELSKKPRRDTYDEIVSAGFDIADVAQKYEQFYLSPNSGIFLHN